MGNNKSSAFPAGLVVYQIYPRSFSDSDGDGVGDLPGIIGKLDYLKDLGVGAIWLCPIYTSPMVDFGYDVSDYETIDPVFGTLADVDRLIAEAHARGIRVLLDLVVNHTSNQHEWFKQSRSSRDNPKRDWYIWHDGSGGDNPLPNNWLSVFGGPAWEFDPHTKQYYLHSFAKQQPDLNWQNPDVRAAVKDIMRFWLDRGVDGFRADAINWYAKDPDFRDDPPNPHFDPETDSPYDMLMHGFSINQPALYDYLREMTDVLESYGDRFMLLESHFDLLLDVPSYLNFYEHLDTRVAAPFNFAALNMPWNAASYKSFIDAFQAGLPAGATPVYTAGNHDRSRLSSRIGPDATRAAAVLFFTLPGTAMIYYGEEIGMQDAKLPESAIQDIYEKSLTGRSLDRDPERTPMQWSAEPNAGFSIHEPWLPVAPNFREQNVATESADPHSLLNLYKKLLAFRATSSALKQGSYRPLDFGHPHLFGYAREHGADKLATVINFSRAESIPLNFMGKLVFSTHDGQPDAAKLQPLEARIIQTF